MQLQADGETKGGSFTEVDEIHGNQLQLGLQSRKEEDQTKTAIELVENTPKSFEEDVAKRNDKEGPEYGELLGESGTQSCDKVVAHDGINIKVLYGELTMKKMWHERTWFEILKHFVTTGIMSVFWTFLDVGFDINAVLEYWNEGNSIWGWITLFLIFSPGPFFSYWFRKAYNIGCCCPESLSSITSCSCCEYFLFHPLSPFGNILFPFILISVKIVSLFNPGQEWKRLTVKITSFEADFETSPQMLLTLYIVIVRASNGLLPFWWQYPQLTFKMVMITKIAIADYLLPRQPMSFTEELKATILLIPLFLSNCVFKVVSFATVAAMLWYVTFFIFPVVILLLHLPNFLACCCRLKIGYLTLGSPKHIIKLLVIRRGGRTTRQSMKNFFYNNIWWFIFYTVMLFLLRSTGSFKGSLGDVPGEEEEEEEGIDQKDIGGRELPQEIFHVLCGVIFSALVLNIVLIYFQLWRPFKAEQQDRNEDMESSDEIEEEGSRTVFMNIGLCGLCLCFVFIALIIAAIVIIFVFGQKLSLW